MRNLAEPGPRFRAAAPNLLGKNHSPSNPPSGKMSTQPSGSPNNLYVPSRNLMWFLKKKGLKANLEIKSFAKSLSMCKYICSITISWNNLHLCDMTYPIYSFFLHTSPAPSPHRWIVAFAQPSDKRRPSSPDSSLRLPSCYLTPETFEFAAFQPGNGHNIQELLGFH